MDSIQQMDFTLLNFINENLRNPLLDKLMPFVSSLADNGILWIIIAVAHLLGKKERRTGTTLFLALLIESILCNGIMKPLIHRIRPYDINTAVTLLIRPLTDYSFPSGHTAASFAAAAVIYAANKKWGLCAFVLAAVIGFSRLYLYVHFPSDVIAGAILGILSGAAAVFIDSTLRR